VAVICGLAEPATTAWEFQNLILCAAKCWVIRLYVGIAACGLNRSSHIQIFMVAMYAKLQRIFEMAIGQVVKHNRLPLKSLLFYSRDTMLSE
jgi:hypothetical protein